MSLCMSKSFNIAQQRVGSALEITDQRVQFIYLTRLVPIKLVGFHIFSKHFVIESIKTFSTLLDSTPTLKYFQRVIHRKSKYINI